MTHGRESDEPIGDQVPIADAVDQRLAVDETRETRELSENFEPTEVSEIAAEGPPPEDANPADWQEQLTSADTGAGDWDSDID